MPSGTCGKSRLTPLLLVPLLLLVLADLFHHCCSQGALRDALDRRLLPQLPATSTPHPAVVFSLTHDIAAAMMHLHSEGIV